jgi:hypothetical protein
MYIQTYHELAEELRFVSRVSAMGNDRLVINVPKEVYKRAQPFKGERVIVTIRKVLEDYNTVHVDLEEEKKKPPQKNRFKPHSS